LWLEGSEAACFDGTRFFLLRDYGLPPAEVLDFSEDSSGAVWIGAETGLRRAAWRRSARDSLSA
jgi:ligand-binding sensor domain-containing protein